MEKVGRNDPCPCGSGKKYKNCHWGKETPKTYTPDGKRKFRAKVLTYSDQKSQSVFQGSSPQVPQEMPTSLDKLKFRKTQSDFRVKEAEAAPMPFAIPSPETAPTSSPEPSADKEFKTPPLPPSDFKPATEDFREKKQNGENK